MKPERALAGIDVALLAGGLGSRIRNATGDADARLLAPVAGRAFLHHLLAHLAHYGARRVILALGHHADQVTAWLAQGDAANRLEILCHIEPQPMGTAGALRFIRSDLTTDPVLMVKADRFADMDLRAFVAAHKLAQAEATILCVETEDASRFRRVQVGADGRVRGFLPPAPGPGIIDAGVYLFSAALMDRIAASDMDTLAGDVFPSIAPDFLRGYITCVKVVDTGIRSDRIAADTITDGAV